MCAVKARTVHDDWSNGGRRTCRRLAFYPFAASDADALDCAMIYERGIPHLYAYANHNSVMVLENACY